MLTIILVSLFAISAVSAADNATDEVVSVDDTISNIKQPAGEEISDDTLAADESDGITASVIDEDVLAGDYLGEADVIFVKRTGRYASDTKVYVMLVDHATGEPIGLEHQILIHVINKKTKTDWLHGVEINCYGEGVLNWKDTTQGAGDFVMKVQHDDTWYGLLIKPNQASITVYKNSEKISVKLVAYQKTFKKSVTIKKYTVTLKTDKNKPMVDKYVTLKVNKKTYKTKTNSKGQATFKITNLKKKGTYTVVVNYAGSKYYAAKTVKPKITVK